MPSLAATPVSVELSPKADTGRNSVFVSPNADAPQQGVNSVYIR